MFRFARSYVVYRAPVARRQSIKHLELSHTVHPPTGSLASQSYHKRSTDSKLRTHKTLPRNKRQAGRQASLVFARSASAKSYTHTGPPSSKQQRMTSQRRGYFLRLPASLRARLGRATCQVTPPPTSTLASIHDDDRTGRGESTHNASKTTQQSCRHINRSSEF